MIGDNEPLVLLGYRFYTSFNKGFAPAFLWLAKQGEAQFGTVHMPAYPIHEYRQARDWTLPGTSTTVWTQLQFDEVILDPDKPSSFRLPRQYKLVVRLGEMRAELQPGESIELPDGRLEYRGLGSWMGYTVFSDWTTPWLVAATALAVPAWLCTSGASSRRDPGTRSMLLMLELNLLWTALVDFFNAAIGNYDFTTPTFTATPAGYLLTFNYAYATFATEIDSLYIHTSTDGGTTYSSLIGLAGGPTGLLNTGGATTAAFTPTAGQWGIYQILLPTGTNKIRFRGASEFGNNLFLDNINVDAAPPLPGCAINQVPADLATNQARDLTLTWAAGVGGTPTSYKIYLSTNLSDVTTEAPAALVNTISGTSYTSPALLASTIYY